MKIPATVLFLIFATFVPAAGQTIDKWIAANEKVPVEKLYLHTNKEFYFQDETIWFKSYLLDSRSGQLIPGAENIYVYLLDDNGKTIIKTMLMSVNGQAPGNIQIPDTLKAGKYILQACTDYLLNFNPDAFFYQPISISRITPTSRVAQNQQRFSRQQQMIADVSFLPEGGCLLENVPNLVAFKAINRDGYGVEAKGALQNEEGDVVTEFSTDYKGMGLFFFTPVAGKTYTARINGFPSFRYNFDSATVKEGVKLQVINHTSSELIVNIASNSDKFTGQTFYLVNMNRGEVVFYQAFETARQNHVLKFNSENLKGGINRLVLLDKNLKPISERLVFSENYTVNNLGVTTGAEILPARSDCSVSVSDGKLLKPDEFSNLSVAVVHEDALNVNGQSQNILSYLLLNSELNGYVESSADFLNDDQIDSKSKLRLLMLTNGWNSYFWNNAPAANAEMAHKQKTGIDIHGTAVSVMSETPVENGEITLIIEKDDELAVMTQKTGVNGQFLFPGLLFNDTASIYIQAKNEKGKLNTNITLFSVMPLPAPSNSQIAAAASFFNTPYQLQRQKYYGDLAYREFDPEYRSRRINQVDVIEEREAGSDGHFRMYNKADQVIEVPVSESSHSNIIDFMTGKATGVDINAGEIRIRGASGLNDNSTPLFLVDGVPLISEVKMNMPDQVTQNSEFNENRISEVLEKVKSIPLGDIEKVEILKSPENLAMFGTEGANGVVAIYTRHGKVKNTNPLTKGLLERKIAGYASYKKFYSPKYTPENKNNPAPDYRTTLFWDSEISTQNGLAELSFYTSDQTGRYAIFVEGVTNKGTTCLGNAIFEVVAEADK